MRRRITSLRGKPPTKRPARRHESAQLSRSTIIAMPCPPPTHMVSSPTVLSCVARLLSRVPVMRGCDDYRLSHEISVLPLGAPGNIRAHPRRPSSLRLDSAWLHPRTLPPAAARPDRRCGADASHAGASGHRAANTNSRRQLVLGERCPPRPASVRSVTARRRGLGKRGVPEKEAINRATTPTRRAGLVCHLRRPRREQAAPSA